MFDPPMDADIEALEVSMIEKFVKYLKKKPSASMEGSPTELFFYN